MLRKSLLKLTTCLAGTAMLFGASSVQAETLRLLTWGSYAPDEVIKLFEEKYPDITVEVTFSNNEEMIAKLRATGGAGYDLAQPSHDRIYAAQLEYNIYKPMDLSKIDTSVMQANLLDGVKANTTIEGEVYSVPHQWGTSGLMADKTKAPDVDSWDDLCDPQYAGRTSMRLKRTILLGTAFSLGHDPFAAYADLDQYQQILDEVTDRLQGQRQGLLAGRGRPLGADAFRRGYRLRDLGQHRLQAIRAEPEHRVHSAGNRGARLDRYLHHSEEGRGG